MLSESYQFIEDTISTSSWHMDMLRAVRKLGLPDWAIGAGFVRNAVWDRLHGFGKFTPLADIDVLYFDRENVDRTYESEIEKTLYKIIPDQPWSVRNQARMHVKNNDHQYRDTEDAISYWLETPTCVAVRLEDDDCLHVIAPSGLDDLIRLYVQPTPMGHKKYDQYLARVHSKSWPSIWPKVRVEGLKLR